jgi:hypothetical protein
VSVVGTMKKTVQDPRTQPALHAELRALRPALACSTSAVLGEKWQCFLSPVGRLLSVGGTRSRRQGSGIQGCQCARGIC